VLSFWLGLKHHTCDSRTSCNEKPAAELSETGLAERSQVQGSESGRWIKSILLMFNVCSESVKDLCFYCL